MISYHLTNIRFKKLNSNFGDGKKLNITYLSTDGKTISLSFLKDNNIYIDNISDIVKAVYGKDKNWKNVIENLKRALVKNPSPDKKTLLVNGYSFKFIKRLFPFFEKKYNLLLDNWTGSDKHNKELSQLHLNRSDFIFCEWCLGNALWYSKNKLPHQKLIIRLHRWEMTKDYWKKINWNNVDGLICISPYLVNLMKQNLSNYVNIVYIQNYINPLLFNVKKSNVAKYNFGMLGYTPKLKNPIKTIEFFDDFKKKYGGVDADKYKLFFKGFSPFKQEQTKQNKTEMDYYEKMFNMIKDRKDIIIEGFNDNICSWFSKIGYILSYSDIEGSHQAIAEGMSAGCVPFLQGNYVDSGHALDIYPAKYCKKNIILFTMEESEKVRKQFINNKIDNIGLQICKLF
jgi:hypothetical protein